MRRPLVIVGALAALAVAVGGGLAIGMTIEHGDAGVDVNAGVAEAGASGPNAHRGDVIHFERPPGPSSNGEDATRELVKRVIAVGGDTIEAREGVVYVNGERIDEPYLEPGTRTDNLPRQTIPEGYVFVMGDARANSEDSRAFGPVSESLIIDRVAGPAG